MVWSPPAAKVAICNCTVLRNYLPARRHWLPPRTNTPAQCVHSTTIHFKRICWHRAHRSRIYWYGIWIIRRHRWHPAPRRNHLKTYKILHGIVRCSTFWHRCSVHGVWFGIYARMSRSSNWATHSRVYDSVRYNGIQILQHNCGWRPRTIKRRSFNCGIYDTPLHQPR